MIDHQTGSNSLATTALFLGFLSLLSGFTGIGGISFGAMGIILGLLSRTSPKMRTNAKVGIGLSLAGIVLGTALLVTAFSSVESTLLQMIQSQDSDPYTFELPFEDSYDTETPFTSPYRSSPYQSPYTFSSDGSVDL